MFIYIMYLTEKNKTVPSHIKVGYTSQLGSVITNNIERTDCNISIGYHWELPSGANQNHANDIKTALRQQVQSYNRETTIEIIGQQKDLYSYEDFDEIYTVLTYEVAKCNPEVLTFKLPERTKTEMKEAFTDPLELHNRITKWLSNKTFTQIQKYLPAFKYNLASQYTMEEIENELMNIMLKILK